MGIRDVFDGIQRGIRRKVDGDRDYNGDRRSYRDDDDRRSYRDDDERRYRKRDDDDDDDD